MPLRFPAVPLAVLVCAGLSLAAPPFSALKPKVEAKLAELRAWGEDPLVVAEVKAYNAAKPPEAVGMTNEKWKGLSVLDPVVRSFSKNKLGQWLKAKDKDDEIVSEAFVSGADGGKVGLISKTTNWCHKGKPKHDLPLAGKTWIGEPELDESTGVQQVQVSFPVLDGGQPIGSVVVGLRLDKF